MDQIFDISVERCTWPYNPFRIVNLYLVVVLASVRKTLVAMPFVRKTHAAYAPRAGQSRCPCSCT